MSENGVNGHACAVGMQWRVGLMNSSMKYLTAETFAFKVNASGTQLKKKQIWFLEQEEKEKGVYIRSHQGCYLTLNRFGELTAGVEEKTEVERFTVEYSPDGKWAFKNDKYQYYLSGQGTEAKCFSKTLGPEEWWSIQLDVHPQVCLRNVKRKRYAHLHGDELECRKDIPWGSDALITLEFEEGKYCLKSSDGRNLRRDGCLQDTNDANTQFTMEIHDGSLAFKDCSGQYLTAVSQGQMMTKNKNYSKDELFTIEDSHPQVKIKSHTGKYVSVKQGKFYWQLEHIINTSTLIRRCLSVVSRWDRSKTEIFQCRRPAHSIRHIMSCWRHVASSSIRRHFGIMCPLEI